MKKICALCCVLIFCASGAGAQVFSTFQLEIVPGADIPFGVSTLDFESGLGMSSNFTIAPVTNWFRFGLFFGVTRMTSITENNFTSATGGGMVEFKLDLGPMVDIFAGGRGGGYFASYLDAAGSGLYLGGTAGLRFEVMPTMSIGLGAGYSYFPLSADYGVHAIDISANLSFRPFGGGRSRLEMGESVLDPLFPVLYKQYQEKSFGSMSITNNEGQRLKDVEVTFFIPRYMDRPSVVYSTDSWDSRETVNIVLNALFNEDILDLTESTKVIGTVSVSYVLGQEEKEFLHDETFRLLNRNNLTWDDDRKVAAFISPTDPTVLKLAKFAETSIRGDDRLKAMKALRSAMAIFETIRLIGVQYTIDPNSSYENLVSQGSLDYVQFPRQTIDFLAGDCDDLTVLFTALVSAVGHDGGFITVPGHIYAAVSTGLPMEQVRRLLDSSSFVEHEGIAWIPVEITALDMTFNRAWEIGLNEWREHSASEGAVLYPLSEIWNSAYEAVGPYSDVLDFEMPSRDNILNRFNINMGVYIENTIEPMILEKLAGREDNPRALNRAGVMYAKFGIYDQAEEFLKRALDSQRYDRALVNLGNIALLKNNEIEAEEYYKRAVTALPEDESAHLALSLLYYRQGRYGLAAELYSVASELKPSLADRYLYLGSGAMESSERASETARGNPLDLAWGEEE